jgi:hypothetical protein
METGSFLSALATTDRWTRRMTARRRLAVLLMLTAVAAGITAAGCRGDNGDAVRCDSSYPALCIPPPPPDLDCADLTTRQFRVVGADPHNLDPDKDGVGCEEGQP